MHIDATWFGRSISLCLTRTCEMTYFQRHEGLLESGTCTSDLIFPDINKQKLDRLSIPKVNRMTIDILQSRCTSPARVSTDNCSYVLNVSSFPARCCTHQRSRRLQDQRFMYLSILVTIRGHEDRSCFTITIVRRVLPTADTTSNIQ